MSGNRLYFEGLDQLRQELRNLPRDLTGEGSHEMLAAANSAAGDREARVSRCERRPARWRQCGAGGARINSGRRDGEKHGASCVAV